MKGIKKERWITPPVGTHAMHSFAVANRVETGSLGSVRDVARQTAFLRAAKRIIGVTLCVCCEASENR